ncbi:MAG: hypothetical protein HN509_08435 [Halobacteriovoraceae bacterium]|jgi:hypothetical protein|nr:hypothetical protein [Halobacteriovoraceae bacterium]MBT5094131.1 hypothetical protein [Halobacteriovoraceae bacterium]
MGRSNLIIYSLLLGAFTVSSCGTNYKKPESFKDKMNRYSSRGITSNNVPEINVLPSIGKDTFLRSRGPASTKKKKLGNYFLNQSNKRLYFLSLYQQYTELKKYHQSEVAPEINICPSFHSSLVGHREKYGTPKASKNPLVVGFPEGPQSINTEVLALYPELSLPLSVETQHPTVADIIKGKITNKDGRTSAQILEKGLEVHLGKTYQELNELCEHGTSDNYYIYENLIVYIKRHKDFVASGKSMKTLLKTTLFSNMALINSLGSSKGRGPASNGNSKFRYDEAIQKRLGVPWASSYFHEIKKKRKQ